MQEVGIHVELARAVDAASLAEALTGRGLPVELLADAEHSEIWVGRNGGNDLGHLRSEVSSVIEGWVSATSSPLVPTPVGIDGFSLHPGAA